MEPQNTLRDALTASFDEVIETSTPIDQAPIEAPAEKPRDEEGKFSKAQPEVKVETAPEAKTDEPEPQADNKPSRPTTWKKEYLPIWDKLSSGQTLTPEESAKLAFYTQQRETEYKTGVSTYKNEAVQAKALQDAIAPFIPELTSQNIAPNQFIQNLGNAHMMLVKGSPEQKIALFTKLAKDYGVPLQAVQQTMQGGQLDQTTLQLMQEIQNLKSQVSGVAGWRDQLENEQIQAQLSEYADTSKYPYFETVRGNMAQLLESGKAQTLKEAYEQAAAPIEELVSARLAQVAPVQTPGSQKVVQMAKAKAVSPKSSAPSGSVASSSAKDRRSILAEQVDALMGGARV